MLSIMLFAFISLITIYLSGKIILSCFDIYITKELKLFSSYIVGILLWILIYSVVKSSFLTINLGLFPVIVYFVFFYRNRIKSFNFELSSVKNELLLSALIFLPVFIFQAYFYFDFLNDSFKTLHTDHYLYADFSNSLKLFGIESKFTDLIYYNNVEYLVPYHYAELWLTASFSEIFRISSISSYFLIVIPLCASIYAVGVYSLLSKLNHNFVFKYLLIISGLFISGVYFSIYDNFEITKYSYQADNGILSLFSQKLCVVYVFLLFASVLFVNGYRHISIVTFSIIPFFSISFLPSLIGGAILYSIFLFIRRKKIADNFKIGILSALYSGIFILLFYQIFRTSYSNEIIGNDVFLKALISGDINIADLKIFIGNNVYRLIRPLIFYAPFIVFILFFIRKQLKLTFFYFCVILSGVISSSLLYGVMDSGQFASNTYIIINISVIIGLSILLSESMLKRAKYIFSLLFFTIILYNISTTIKNKTTNGIADNKNILVEISNKLDRNPVCILVFLSENDYSSIPLAWWQLKNDLLPLTQYTDNDVIFSIGNPNMFFKANKVVSHSDSLYYKHLFPVNQEILEKGVCTDFINRNNIKYLYIKKGGDLPGKINIDTCFVSEKINGSFYVLK